MNVLRVNFQELYERHLCRHSQFGINVQHLVSVAGIYLSLLGIIYFLLPFEWLLVSLAVPYLGILALNIPTRVFAAVTVIIALLFAAQFTLPEVPWWIFLIAIVVLHRLQVWSHKIYTAERDMTEFDSKYKKGLALVVVLSFYELPLLLHYLIFDTRNWYSRKGNLPCTPQLSSVNMTR
jgi:hypothetical protein